MVCTPQVAKFFKCANLFVNVSPRVTSKMATINNEVFFNIKTVYPIKTGSLKLTLKVVTSVAMDAYGLLLH
jgi:hypothetical protein